MSTKDFRAAATTEIQNWAAANFPAIPVLYENGPTPDEDKVGPVFIDVEFRWYGAQQLSVGEYFKGRNSGAISVNVFYRESYGTGQVDDIVDSLKSTLRPGYCGGGVLKFPQRTVPTHIKGWYKSGLLFPFTLDE